ncbi:Pirin-related protein [Solitalea canadensis DSM 3403]|uniref:Pirin-related protein n=2 Tax=Solitalea canadensis TaxID=995 RepID=H8KL26_SOLCM|nr:Pirin-related protein [Solitalea canadensis DSM 3403]
MFLRTFVSSIRKDTNMKTIFHRAKERGFNNLGWLKSYHSFSFSQFYDPQKMNFGLLRVLNDDAVSAGMGFGAHPHDNMEIVSIPLSGELKHKDSTGRDEVIKTHDVQIMSAGSGITHSEFNNSREKEVKFLQIWVFPNEKNIEPRYEQKTFLPEDRENRLSTVVSPNKEEGGVWINQDAWFSLGNFDENKTISYDLKKEGNGVYVFVLSGEVEVDGNTLGERDAIGIWETNKIDVKTNTYTELLLIEVPMNF